MALQECCGLWTMPAAPLKGITPSPPLLCLLQMRSSIPGLGRVMVFLAAALASASFAIPEDWGEEGETPTKPPIQHPHHVPGMRTLRAPRSPQTGTDLPGLHGTQPVASAPLCLLIAQPQLGPVLTRPPWWYLCEARPHSQCPLWGTAPGAPHLRPQPRHGVAWSANTHLGMCVPPGVQYGQLGTDVTLSCPGVRAG